MAVVHAKTSVIADGGDASLVQPSDWNEAHVIEDMLPATDSTHDLGSAGYRWQNAYVEGIAFPATQVPSAGVNTLDDYEESDYTPAANVITFASASGRYTKIGRLVTVQFDVTMPATADANQCRISLPFTNGSLKGHSIVNVSSLDATSIFLLAASEAYLASPGATTNATYSELNLYGTITYSV